MGDLIIICALAQNNAIGLNNRLPWKRVPEDLKRFKKLTLGHPVIMGRKTCDSIISLNGKALEGRENIILTRNRGLSVPGCRTCDSMEKLLEYMKPKERSFIIGGEQIFRLFLPHADKMELTHIQGTYEADAFFPEFSLDNWQIVNTEQSHGLCYVSYQRP